MKAALLRAPGQLDLVEAPRPVAGPRQALIRVRAAGICGSDVHAYRGSSAFQVYPAIPGHEVAGEVVDLGTEAASLAVGDHVVLDPMVRCGHCYPCRTGRYNCCTSLKVMGVHADGGFAEYLAIDESHLHRISAHVPFEIAATVEPLCIASQGVARGRVAEQDTVLVIGGGTIGLGCLLMARQLGARVACVEPIPTKREIASQLGAELTIDPQTQDTLEAVLCWTHGDGPNVVIEAVGRLATIRLALDCVSSAGRVVLIGITPEDVPFPIPLLIRKELDVVASRNSREQFPKVIALLENKDIDPAPLISQVFPFTSIHEAFRLLTEHPDQARKVILTFG